MPQAWEDVANNPEFQVLSPDQKVAASKQYFDTVVKPNVPPEHITAAQQQFTDHVKETTPRSFGESMSDRASKAMDQKPSGIASLIRKKVLGFDPLTPLNKAADVIASPVGAAGETLERKVGQAVGANPVKLEKAARDTGDVTSELIGILPGGKVAKGAEVVSEGAVAAGKGIAEGGKTMKSGYHARTPQVLDAVNDKYAAMAGKHFADMRTSGVTLKPSITVPAAANVEKEISVAEKGKLNPKLHGQTMEVLSDMKTHAEKGFDVEDLDQYRRRLSEIANKVRLTGNKEDANKARDAIEAIDEQFEAIKKTPGMPPDVAKSIDSLQKAQGIWASRRKFETLSNAVKKAEGDPNKIKAEFDKILNNPKLHRGFSKAQMEAVREAAQNTTTEGLLKMAGKFGITIGTGRAAATGNILPMLEIAGGTMIHGGGIPGFAALTAGTAAKYGQKLLAQGKAEKALKSVDDVLGTETDPLAKRP